jgi:uncharacterized protein (UPF0332 family)/predicted nucleotidyltransferase
MITTERDDPKKKAAVEFTRRLLDSPVGPRVARVILFGSVSRDEAGPDSDVDVLVFAGGPADELSRHAAEAAWEATLSQGEQVAQLTYGVDDLLQPRSYLIHDALKHGQELYTMNEQAIRRQEAAALERKAGRHLEQAQNALARGDFELAVVGAYTAAELAAKGLVLLRPDIKLPSSHGGLIQMFGREYVKTGLVPAEWGRLLNESLETRSQALYDTTSLIRHRDAEPVVTLAQGIFSFLEQTLADNNEF